ncbi:UdgX family uracil-DNA binding protein [Halomonas sp. M20]|uniref:UdgX family uracil-DNA binding protein n=1 Tax=Halomonas sp. M20 TaxID=2763264 RepID=UPI001D0B0EBA|nr:UdgX family uracil-DNA binding protein [Halomonas sp. M20]
MTQRSLFDDTDTNALTAVRIHPDFSSWQQRARQLLMDEVPPQRVLWQPDNTQKRATASSSVTAIRVPKSFLTQASAASCYRSDDRWALLYQLLWRLTHGEKHLMQLAGDRHVIQLRNYAKAVSRDVHKMKAFVRFRAVDIADGDQRYIAWFEPDHYIVEYAAGFFQRRFANMCWSILTPDCCAHWEGSGEVWFSEGADKASAPADDAVEDTWRCYYRSIFNPARVKIQAMMAEMPQKYWKNLPESRLIPELIRDADKRVAIMASDAKSSERLHCGPRPAAPAQVLNEAIQQSESGSIQQLALAAHNCRNCSLWQPATQTVFGEGPVPARIMLIGEQPGDNEDLAGKPFVGPAGELLNRALAAAGLRRQELYITNTVKHFKFRAKGRRRLHEPPQEEEINACAPWLAAEIEQVQPSIIICLGVTAAQAQLGTYVRVTRDRGKLFALQGRHYLVTVHPAYLLRRGESPQEFQRFVADLQVAAGQLNSLDIR